MMMFLLSAIYAAEQDLFAKFTEPDAVAEMTTPCSHQPQDWIEEFVSNLRPPLAPHGAGAITANSEAGPNLDTFTWAMVAPRLSHERHAQTTIPAARARPSDDLQMSRFPPVVSADIPTLACATDSQGIVRALHEGVAIWSQRERDARMGRSKKLEAIIGGADFYKIHLGKALLLLDYGSSIPSATLRKLLAHPDMTPGYMIQIIEKTPTDKLQENIEGIIASVIYRLSQSSVCIYTDLERKGLWTLPNRQKFLAAIRGAKLGDLDKAVLMLRWVPDLMDINLRDSELYHLLGKVQTKLILQCLGKYELSKLQIYVESGPGALLEGAIKRLDPYS